VSEPTTSGAAGFAAFKSIGGLAGVVAIGAGLATVVVMIIQRPRTAGEWAVGLICTVLSSVCGGAMVIEWFNLQERMYTLTGLVSVLGLVFACGLPGWTAVRWFFTWMERRRDHDMAQVYRELRGHATQAPASPAPPAPLPPA